MRWLLRLFGYYKVDYGFSCGRHYIEFDGKIIAQTSGDDVWLRDEFNRGHLLDSPWDCVESECPGFKHPMRKSCSCYQGATKAHIAKVLKEINQS